jgi:XTP/dITP diphosphohydrolase
MTRMPPQQVVLASSSAGKLEEFRSLLADAGFDVLPQADFDVTDVEETGLTFVENAILKARNACRKSGLPAIADDSGLEVEALMDKPGIYSSRFAGVEGEERDSANNQKLINSLHGLARDERTARFQCVLVYMRHAEDPTPIICQGTWEGLILHQSSGDGGFGYDPLFYVPEHDCSAAELSKADKNAISHRGQAMRQLLQQLTAQA